METLFIYLIKSGGIIGIFYLAYYILLRKETFFNSNRWFLLAGLITSVLLPLLVFTKIVWVDPNPTAFDWSKFPVTIPIENESFEINWYFVFAIVYSIGIAVFLIKLTFDFYSLSKVLKGKIIHKQADFKFIDVNENVAPFSYFNSIVYNSSLYSAKELENILEHEKVHSEQNHTVDVLISRLFCIVFWFNPFVWLYKKAITQNLEFIADSEASKIISDKKAYQMTLLKITTQENCVAITNHFYQSLIKKRIIMLNKNQSKKWNSWKYALVLPLLVAFVFLFQIKVIAQEKVLEPTAVEPSKANENSVDIYKINKNTTDVELKEKINALKDKYDVRLAISGVERNSKNELIAIKVDLKKGKEIAKKMDTKGTEAIKTFGIIVSKNENGLLTIDFGTDETAINNKSVLISPNPPSVSTEKEIFIDGSKVSQTEVDKLNPNEIVTMNVEKNSDKSTIKIITKKGSNIPDDAEIYVNGKKISKEEMENLDQNTIETMIVNKDSGKSTIKIITKKGSNIPDATEIYVNGKKISKEEMDKIDPSTIQTVTVSKNGVHQNTIKIITRNAEIKDYSDDLKQAQIDAQQAKRDVEQTKKDTEQAKKDAQQANKDIEQAKKDIEQAKKDTEQARKDAQQAKRDAWQARKDAQQAKINAE